MRRLKNKGRKGIAWLLTAAMVVGLASAMTEPIQAQAEDTQAEETTSWAAPEVRQINFGTLGIIDPKIPSSKDEVWTGCYVYYGNYNGNPVKYRVLDASTTEFGGTTMLLDCDSVLYRQKFDNDGNANVNDKNENDWSISDVKNSLNGEGGFIDTAFTATEKSAIATSKKTESITDLDGAGGETLNYASLNGEKIFLLDAKEATRKTYGYFDTRSAGNHVKYLGSEVTNWWLRSASSLSISLAGYVYLNGGIGYCDVSADNRGVSPAFNLNLSSVIFSSASGKSKSSALTSESDKIDTTTKTDWKLTLKDTDKTVNLTEGGIVTQASDGTITVPYTYTDNENATDKEKVNQISVMITDKAYGSENAQILYYGALQDIKDTTGNESTVAEAFAGTGTFVLPSGLEGTLGTDYHIYFLAEHVNTDDSATGSVDESLNTDYASEPVEVTTIWIGGLDVTDFAEPTAEKSLDTEVTVTTGVSEATLTWKKGEAEVIGNAEWNTTYQTSVTLKATDGYTFKDAAGNITGVTLNGNDVESENITLNEDNTCMVICREYPVAKRKTVEVTAPEAPVQFTEYYDTIDDVFKTEKFGTTAAVTLQGTTQPNPENMDVTWSVVDKNGASAEYNKTPAETNIFKWTINEDQYEDYNVNDTAMEGIVTIQNKRYVPEVTAIPTVTDRVYHPTKVLADTDLIGGEVKDKDGTVLAGTWSWKEKDVVPSVDKAEYEATFTPEDIEHYAPITKTVTVKVTKATPVVVTKPVATTIAIGDNLATSTLSGGKVQFSEKDTIEIAGTFSWKDATIQPAATDSGVTEYAVVFTPKDTVNYETVETKITVMISTLEVGTKQVSDDGKATYKVTTSDLTKGTVTYVAPTDKKKTTVAIPATVKIDGVTYKVTAIEKNAFKNNKKLKKITIGSNIKTIGVNAFYGCKKLKTVKMGKNVTTIGDKAFYKCTSLTSITIPSKVTKIGKSAFEGCKKLKTVTIKSSKLTAKKVGSKAFKGIKSDATIKVPKKKYKTYKSMLRKKGVSKKAKFKKI